MIKTFILIMLIEEFASYGTYTVTQEFNSLETCNTALSSIAQQNQWTDRKGKIHSQVKAYGCYEK